MKKSIILISGLLLFISCLYGQNSVNSLVVITTSKGVIKVKLYNETPLHRDNFLKLANSHYYDSVLFHRVIKDFMIQTGDPQSKHAPANTQLGNGGPGYTIPAEFNPLLFHKKGALAAARTGDNMNPQKASSGSQFYIVKGNIFSDESLTRVEVKMNVKRSLANETPLVFSKEQRVIYESIGGTPFLDMNYTVFGEVVEGLDVLDAIDYVATGPGDRPLEDVIILSTTVVKK